MEGTLLSESGDGVTRVAAVLAAGREMSDFDYGLRARAAGCSVWAVYTRRWSGRLWPVYWLSPYVHHGVRLALERTPLGRPRRAMS